MDKERRVKLFLDRFPANPNRHGLMTAFDQKTGKKKGVTVHEKVTLGIIHGHLDQDGHKGRIGMMPGTEEGTNVGMTDVDRKTYGEAFDRVTSDYEQALNLTGVTWYKERTTNDGWHFYVFVDRFISHEMMYYFLRWATHESGHPELEIFPSSADAGVSSRWMFLPYAGANLDPEGYGLSWLQDKHGEKISIDMLSEIVTNPESTILLYAESFKQEALTTHKNEAEVDTMRVADLDPEAAWEELHHAVTHPPFKSGWARHDALIAFINIADRARRASDMIELLKSEEVWRLWTGGDGSRTTKEWESEIDRWAQRWRDDQAKMRPKHGIKHLLDSGWELGQLKKTPNSLLATGINLNKLPEDEIALLASELLSEQKIHWCFDPEYQTAYKYDGKTWVPFPRDPAEDIKHDLERILSNVGKGLREAKLSAVYKKMERNYLRRYLNAEIDHELIACKNGLLNWRTLELLPHSPHQITIGRVDAEWQPDIDIAGIFQRYLSNVWKDQEEREQFREILQEFVGYGMIREAKMRSILELHGPSSTGKTTVWRALMGFLGNSGGKGHWGLALSTTQDVFDAQDWGAHFIAPSLVIFDEISTADRRSGQKVIVMLKTLAGGGSISVNPKGRASTTVESTAKLVLCTNSDLRLHEDTANDSMFRRLVRLPFTRVVPMEKEVSRVDERILEGGSERERIFKWAVDGLRRLASQGWNLSHRKTSNAQMDASREAANPVIEFLQSYAEVKVGMETPMSALRSEFKVWAEVEGHTKAYSQISPQKFTGLLHGALVALGWNTTVKTKKVYNDIAGKGTHAVLENLIYVEIS